MKCPDQRRDPNFVRPSASPTNCYPSDRMMHQVPEWFMRQPHEITGLRAHRLRRPSSGPRCKSRSWRFARPATPSQSRPASMFSVRLCSAAGRQHGFSLQGAGSGRERLNIISAAHAKLRPVGVSDPTAPRPSVEVGVQASLECASAHASGFPGRAASSHAPQRWSTHSWLPRRPRPWQAFACRAIMQRAHRVDLALSGGDVARARPAEHNRTLNIGAVMRTCT
jgi:hypothetical protein